MSFQNWSIGRKLWLLTAVSSAVLLVTVIFNSATTRQLTDRLTNLGHTELPAVRAMTLADMMHDGIRAVVFRSLLAAQTQNASEIAESVTEFAEFSANIRKHLADLKKTGIRDELKAQIDAATTEVEAYIKSGQSVLDLAAGQKYAEAMRLVPAFQASFKDLEDKLEKIGEGIESEAQQSIQDSEATARRAESLGLIIAGLGLAAGALASAWLGRSIIRRLQSVVERLEVQSATLGSNTVKIDDSAQALSSASTEQAAAVQETAAALEQVSAMVARTAENSQRLAGSSQASHQAVEEGQQSVNRMLSEMDTIKNANLEVVQQIEESNVQIKNIVRVISEIGEKTKVINDIVFQTKLLSFNASVEAARAGEHGKGFAVVAEEVGNLAAMSGNASKDISEMLESGIRQVSEIVDSNRRRVEVMMAGNADKIEAGRLAADQCGEVFTKIVGEVAEVTRLSSEISTAIQEQRTGLDEINKAVSQFSESTQANSANAQGSSSLARDLKDGSHDLSVAMGDLEFLVTGRHRQVAAKIETPRNVQPKRRPDSARWAA